MMGLGRSASKNKCENRTTSSHLYSVPRAASNIIAVHAHTPKDVTTSQSGIDIHEDYLDSPSHRVAQNNSGTVRSASTGYGSRNGPEGEIPCRLLTTQVLHEHNLRQAYISTPPASIYVSQYDHIAMLGVDPLPTGDTRHDLTRQSAGGFNNSIPDTTIQAHSSQNSNTKLYSEAESDTSNYQSACHGQSRSDYCERPMDILDQDMFDVDPSSWDKEPGQELTAWGNSLAGVGEHLVGHAYQEYTRCGELVVDS